MNIIIVITTTTSKIHVQQVLHVHHVHKFLSVESMNDQGEACCQTGSGALFMQSRRLSAGIPEVTP